MYLKYVPLLLVISLTLCSHVASLDGDFSTESRIVGGSDERIENAPWQISLQFKERHICGGSIYSEDIIITAAHCVVKLPEDGFEIRAGSSIQSEGGTLVKVAYIISHEKYNRPIYANDIAVLRLAEPLTFGASIKAIPLAKRSPKRCDKVTLTGWGRTGYWNRPSLKLQTTTLEVMSKSRCRWAFFLIPSAKLFCAQSKNSAACSGDSGGPLVLNGELVGIASFGRSDCRGPSAYTDVAKMQKWILEAIEKISTDIDESSEF
ncbi:hypothetical protein ACLKA7_004244 [Drosophila subpalustris]